MALVPFRRVAPLASLPLAGGIALALPVALLLDGPRQWTALGGLAAAVAWAQLAALVAWNGTAHLPVVHHEDRTTAQVLRHRLPGGWRALHGTALVDQRAVDHVALGPGGVVVLETKWRRDPTPGDLEWAARRALLSQADVAGVLRPVLADAPVVPAIVIWGADEDDRLPVYVDGVRVVKGEHLGAWLELFATERLGRGEVDAAWGRLLCQAADQRIGRAATALPQLASRAWANAALASAMS
jgi:hypothetical protein